MKFGELYSGINPASGAIRIANGQMESTTVGEYLGEFALMRPVVHVPPSAMPTCEQLPVVAA